MRTYGKLTFMERRWEITELEPHVCIKLKNLFPKIPKHQSGAFHFADTPETCADLIWFTQRYPLQMSDNDRRFLTLNSSAFYKTQAEMEEILKPDYTPHDYELKKGQTIRVYQAQAGDILHKNKALLVGDEVGLGKTYTGIGAILKKDTLPAAVVVQTHLPRQWKEKIESFSHLKVHLIKGTRPYSLPPADVYIFKYSCLSGWVDTFMMGYFKTVIFDEIQELRRGTASGKGCAAKTLASNTEYRMGLTATPIYNYGDEMWNIMDILKEGCLGSLTDFLREWGSEYGQYATIKDPKALGTYLRENYLFLRRTRADVGQYLAPINTIIETVGYDEQTVKSAEELAHKLAIRASEGSFIERGQAARELDMMVRQMTGISKAKYVAEFVKIILESGEPVLLGGWHRGVYDIWLEELKDYKPVMYTGSESPNQKDRAKEAFTKGDSNLMILSLRSGVGLDGLQARCSIGVIGELDWSPAVHHQFFGRLDREGQTKPVMGIYLCSDSGSDPLIIDLLGLKSSQSQAIIDPALGVQTVHNDESRLQLLVQKYLSKKGQATLF